MEVSGPSERNKFIIPGEDDNQDEKQNIMRLSVDPDYEEENEENRPAPINKINEPQERSVKMSIGNWDDDEEDEDEVEEAEVGPSRIAQEMWRFREKENFDFEENEDIKAFFKNKVSEAMFPGVNTIEDNFGLIKSKKGPKIIEGYLWGAVIGVGSYGKVKEVLDTFTLTRRAAKIMKHDKIKKNTKWLGEYSKHPNVIKLQEVFEIPEKKKIYMIFEYCIGSVQQLLDIEPAKRLTQGECHKIFCEMIHGLDYLHSRRISHKDIKPGNLLISIDFTIKICDFGVAEEISMYQENGNCTKVNGTPKFQPPECVAGNHQYFDGYKADIWGAGVTLYNLISGKYPFDCPRLIQLYDSIAKDELVMPTNVPISNCLQDLIQKLLEKDFEKRITTNDAMLHSWFLTSFPEDEGLGRIMERMRTGDRPLTMRPSMEILFEKDVGEFQNNASGNSEMAPLTYGGELDSDAFRGFKYLKIDPQPTDDEKNEDKKSVDNSKRKKAKKSIFSCIFRPRSGS
ncbi:unnamed protein product [Caenorhabditis angaria]|uniref:non-specific serine/threonine protein kinase n=1 Tax=Caenorhabditis angaria TaxID=860376 RepID=A0A9P1N4P9_9PELO|nr:unnamed protein product [Caenorhabditis angaria]